MARGISIFIAMVIMATGANAASVRGVRTASRNGTTTATEQMVNPASSYTYNYMYPYLNNQMRTTLKPADPTSPSTSPINAIVRTEQLSTPRRVVPRRTTQTTTTTANTGNTTVSRAATNTGTINAGRRVVPRPSYTSASQNTSPARSATRAQNTTSYATTTTTSMSSARCLADYTECMNQYCERANTAYNRCYCSAKLAQIDAEYQPQIDSLVKQIIALQYNNSEYDSSELNEYWASTISKYTSDNSWENIDDALNIDWSTMESRVRGQNAFLTGHEYCAKHLDKCFYMASNLRDIYVSEIARDCDSYKSGLEKLKNVAESVIEAYKE